jgi:hypothetical protein
LDLFPGLFYHGELCFELGNLLLMLLALEVILHLADLSVLALCALLDLILLHALVELVNGLAKLLILAILLSELLSDLFELADLGLKLCVLKFNLEFGCEIGRTVSQLLITMTETLNLCFESTNVRLLLSDNLVLFI